MKLADIETVGNVDEEEWRNNIRHSSSLPLPWLERAPAHDGVVLLCGGAPSLADSVDELRWRQELGQKIVAINNTARWLVDRGLLPDYQFMIDALPQSADYVFGGPWVHVLASQCHPDVFANLRGAEALLFHMPDVENLENCLPENRRGGFSMIGGGRSGRAAWSGARSTAAGGSSRPRARGSWR